MISRKQIKFDLQGEGEYHLIYPGIRSKVTGKVKNKGRKKDEEFYEGI